LHEMMNFYTMYRPEEKIMKPEDQFELDFKQTDDLMKTDYHEKMKFESIDFRQYEMNRHTFEDCEFQSCHFSEMSLAGAAFRSCQFVKSELALVNIENATLHCVIFQDCKIIGLNFTDCNPFGFSPEFENCLIESTVYYSNSLKKGKYINCQIRNTDFIECDLREVDFSNSRFEKTAFQKCNLEKADFRTAHNYQVDPFTNRIKKAKFSLPEAQTFLGFLGIDIE
jgi:fluoroquinolone resistance protein